MTPEDKRTLWEKIEAERLAEEERERLYPRATPKKRKIITNQDGEAQGAGSTGPVNPDGSGNTAKDQG